MAACSCRMCKLSKVSLCKFSYRKKSWVRESFHDAAQGGQLKNKHNWCAGGGGDELWFVGHGMNE